MQATDLKPQARRLLKELPDDATWDALVYHIYVRQAIEEGFADSEAGRTLDAKEVRKKFGLPK